ncbi:uncharacterized protein BXIN_1813 [Babesia sp. Xinjiang]|uniref:uncharacterized protein n=1 Tax=Babesia sp. Xinjiang TaxID=462227 RepID=UPI000A25965E|nr:uncharacterized protein BXIN_1813 [Babesia sp. Xinjiang]ORM39602.1 hypothetical protein BXIN_1813 [Babesia sp. Xinjiang]
MSSPTPSIHSKQCGKSDTHPSPLQAFLCDVLTPFQCQSLKNRKCEMKNGQLVPTGGSDPVPYSDHVSHRNFNQYCPVPMGFNHEMLTHSDRTGNYIYWIVEYFTQTNRNSVSLCNIFICLMCCSLRTPRTVGDLFGFFFSIGENMNNGGSSSPKVAEAIKKSAENIPWNSDGSCSMTDALKTLAGSKSDHNGASHTPEATLYSLRYSECDNDKTCGKYLDPLASNIYPIISASFAETYLKWIIYLTHALKQGLKQLQKDFQKLKCKHHQNHSCTDNCHSTKSCLCPTIVQCADVLPLFFKFGFLYYSHYALNGYDKDGEKNKSEWLRQCVAFSKELNKLLNHEENNEKLFTNLLSVINKFLFCIRKPFLLYLLTFWLLALTYLTYSLTIPLDLLHIRSHWRRASSHQISVLALLSHKAMAPTKVGYFTP